MVGKVALVTGAASGIGKATGQRLAAEGAKVALAEPGQLVSVRRQHYVVVNVQKSSLPPEPCAAGGSGSNPGEEGPPLALAAT